jgi:hypothetical protein
MTNSMLRRLIYSLKKQWGRELSYVQILGSTTDYGTGSRSIERRIYNLTVVVLPAHTARKFIQDIGYLAANKNFTYGGVNDYNKAMFLFDRSELPDDFQPDLNGYINYNGKRYERVSIDNLLDTAFMLVAQGVEGANPYAVIDVRAGNILQMQGEVAVELN